MRVILYTAMFLLLVPAILIAQAGETSENQQVKKNNVKIEPFLMLQLWSSYSIGQTLFDAEKAQYEPVDDRFNIMLRRARIGFRAQPYEGLEFTVVTAYDMIGRDIHSALVGEPNNGAIPKLGIWDAYLQWSVHKNSEAFNIVAGYFRPQLSRESITSGWSVNSMEKSMSQNYIRKHLVGTGVGRAAGLNVGGLLLHHKINYNIGIFNPVFHSNNGNSTGVHYAPLLSGRVAVNIGEPEMNRYKVAYDINYFNERHGLTLAAGAAWQGRTDLFSESYMTSVDMLLNLGAFNLDGEWNQMWREGRRSLENEHFITSYATGHIRAGYNVMIDHRFFIEPSFMLMHFAGALDAEGQENARALNSHSGTETTYDAGVNWYLNRKNLKLMLHYTWHTGQPGAAGAGAAVNTFFHQKDVGAIQRGNWLGLGMHAIF
ncbi:MAG TPA: porin [Saprospiraceae bacterium]|nr:porin [Saprospiraceae bacterium]HMP24973.1 porin [Saprospiraceae bacterium]